MRILWVKIGGLWPATLGGRLRSVHVLSELSQRHAVTLLTTSGPDDDPDGLRRRLPCLEASIAIPFASPKQGSGRFAKALVRSWLTRYPVDLWKVRVPAVQHRIRTLLQGGRFDVVVMDFLFAAVNVDRPSPVATVLFAHNVEHIIWRRLAELERRPWRRAVLAAEWRKMARVEASVCRSSDLTIAVSDTDAAMLAAGAPGATIRTVPTGVDTSYFHPNGAVPVEHSIVFSGAMDWFPNEDALAYFMESVLPRIRVKLPRVSLTIVGRNPSARLRTLAGGAGVTVTGTVDDIRPYIDRARVYVVPLRIGGGTRLKIFEAMAMAKPVVSTSVGAEGLPIADGQHFVRADEPEKFADEVVSLLLDEQRRTALGDAGRALVEQRYSWRHVAAEFEAHCREAVERHEHAR